MSQVYNVEVTMTVRKLYRVKASDKDEAIQKLVDSGIVNTQSESGFPEDYDEVYKVVGADSSGKKADVE